MTTACVLQHIACETMGEYAEILWERGVDTRIVTLGRGDALPDLESMDLVIAMGGPMSVNDEHAHGWLAEEKHRIGAAVASGTPYFGVCLGAQLLAASCNAAVFRGPRPEVGVLPVTLSTDAADDRVFGDLPDSMKVLQWHSDTFELPVGAVRLASSEVYCNQAFRVGERAYGVQFHLEVTEEMFREWCAVPAYRDSLHLALGRNGSRMLAEAFADARGELQKLGRVLFERFVDAALAPR